MSRKYKSNNRGRLYFDSLAVAYWIDVFTHEEIESNLSESRRVGLLWLFEHATSKAGNVHQRMFWQHHNRPIELWRQDVIEHKLNYIHQNPVKAGHVKEPEQWLHSSTLNYSGSKGLINVGLLF